MSVESRQPPRPTESAASAADQTSELAAPLLTSAQAEWLRRIPSQFSKVLDPAEIDLSFKKACELRDLETGERLAVNPRGLADEYRKVFGAFLDQYQKACAGMNIDYRLVRTDQTLETFVRAYLEERRRLSK